MYYCTIKEYRKKQDCSLVGKTPSFPSEYSQLFIHKLFVSLAVLIPRNSFFKAFASVTLASPLEKSWLRPSRVFFEPMACHVE